VKGEEVVVVVVVVMNEGGGGEVEEEGRLRCAGLGVRSKATGEPISRALPFLPFQIPLPLLACVAAPVPKSLGGLTQVAP